MLLPWGTCIAYRFVALPCLAYQKIQTNEHDLRKGERVIVEIVEHKAKNAVCSFLHPLFFLYGTVLEDVI